jgi:periplasmic protein TonB
MTRSVVPKPHKANVVPLPHIRTLDAVLEQPRLPRALPLSLALHTIAAIALVVVPVLTATQLPEPTASVRAFFVEPQVNAVPPPPPPPPAVQSVVHRPTAPVHLTTGALVAPIDIPAEVPNPGLDLGVEGGMPGGVEGGVEGGVLGGVVGGLPSEPTPPVAPVRIGGSVKAPTRLKYVAPEYPSLAVRARVSGVVVVDAILSPDGRVTGAKVLRSIPLLDDAALAAVRQWVYTPTLVGGVPVPVAMSVTVNFNLTS